MTRPDPPHWLIQEPFVSYEESLRRKGKSAIDEARRRTPEEIVAEIERAGLRGRGGAGFPTGAKWRTTMRHEATTRYAVCNAAEGEPGTFKDRYLLRRNPYTIRRLARCSARDRRESLPYRDQGVV